MSLPVEAYLGEIRRRVRSEGRLLLSAAPGAGKTSCVPGALAEEFPEGKILLVEPRRVAASAAAMRISALRGEQPGESAGFSVRGEHCIGKNTRIIAMTPGVLLRKIQEDPALTGIAVVIFDEFHERSLENDLLFSFVLESSGGYRDDLRIVVMSATLESSRLQELLGVESCMEIPGREFPVEQLWSEEKTPPGKIPEDMAGAILRMLPASEGNLLAFFPGAGEIRKCAALLENRLPDGIIVEELHGGIPLKDQNRILAPVEKGKRKIVLSTNVAESSLTVDNVRCVIDSGYERVPRCDSRSGLSFLETAMISRASAAQRTGRAGRVAPGKALRLWDAPGHNGRAGFRKPEILESELSRLLLELSIWGAKREDLAWLDMPPRGAYSEAQKLLRDLGALDAEDHPTALGVEIARLPVHPRLGAIIAEGRRRGLVSLAIEIAALLENRPDASFPESADLELHIEHLRRHLSRYRNHKIVIDQLRSITGCRESQAETSFCGELLLAGFPERLARQRFRNRGSYTMRNGRGGEIAEADTLFNAPFLAVAEIGGRSSGDGTIFKAAKVSEEYVLSRFGDQMGENRRCSFDENSGKVICRQETHLGAIVLKSIPAAPEPGELARGIFDAALKRKLPLIPESDRSGRSLWERFLYACRTDPEKFTLLSEEDLADKAWSCFPELKNLGQLEHLRWENALRFVFGGDLYAELNRLYPEKFRTPAGAEHRIDYTGEEPLLRVRLQEMLGVTHHPVIGKRQHPLRIELLSPALRPVQTTSDLPGFWTGSYELVRKEMKARYPKHEWPENGASAPAMLRTLKKR